MNFRTATNHEGVAKAYAIMPSAIYLAGPGSGAAIAEESERGTELYPCPVALLRRYKAILELFGLQGEFIVNLRYVNLRGCGLCFCATQQAGHMLADEVTLPDSLDC